MTDKDTHTLRVVAPDGTINTLAGIANVPGVAGEGDGGASTAAYLNHPKGVAVASDGTVYVTDSGTHRVRILTPPASTEAQDAALSDNATLSALTLSGITFGTFTNEVTAYTATVDNAIATTTVTATATHASATVIITDAAGSITDRGPQCGRHHRVDRRHGGRRGNDADLHRVRDPSSSSPDRELYEPPGVTRRHEQVQVPTALQRGGSNQLQNVALCGIRGDGRDGHAGATARERIEPALGDQGAAGLCCRRGAGPAGDCGLRGGRGGVHQEWEAAVHPSPGDGRAGPG